MARTSSKKKDEMALEAEIVEIPEVVAAEVADAAEVAEQPKKRTRITTKSVKLDAEDEAETLNDDIDNDAMDMDDDSTDAADVPDESECVIKVSRRGRRKSVVSKGSAPFVIEELDKANVWTLNEQELYDMYIAGRRQDSFAENETHYMNIIRPVFDFVLFDINNCEKKDGFEKLNYSIFPIPSTSSSNAVAIRRRPIKKITDLTLENIYYVPCTELLRLIDENMGIGWQGLPLYIQDIILTGFFVDCSVMPEFALHREGGIIDRRKEDGYEVLEIARGTWIEAVFVKPKPKQDKLHFEAISDKPVKKKRQEEDEDDDEEGYDEEEEEVDDDEEEELDDAEDEDMDMEDEEQEPEFEDIDMIDPDGGDE